MSGRNIQEQQNIEWKESWRDEYLKWICGFANAQGGKIYIGYSDKGELIGIENSKKLLEEIPNKVRESMGIIVDVDRMIEDGKEYLVIVVPAYPIGISYKGIYHYRSGSTKQVLTGTVLESFLMKKRGITWDDTPIPTFRLEDVDDKAIMKFRNLALRKGRIDKNLLEESKEMLLEKLHMYNGKYLNHAAMLLFSDDPEKYQVGAYIKIGYFENDADLLYQDEIHGSILEQVDKAIELIQLKYMKARITYEGMQRIERYFVPELALREALVNAICHKQYQSGVPIQVSVYEDKLYIANDGCLPENWTLDNLLTKHASKPYNPNIANVFYYAGFIESWGRGIEKISSTCKLEGVPVPEYIINPSDIMIKFTAKNEKSTKVTNRVTEKVTNRVTEKVTNRVTDQEKKILELIDENPRYTMLQLSEKIGVSRKTIGNYLKELRDKKIIERIGTQRNGYWKIRNEYGGWVTEKVTNRVTDQEKKILELLDENPRYTMLQLSEKIGVSRKTIGNYLKKLHNENIIERIGSSRSGYWVIKTSSNETVIEDE